MDIQYSNAYDFFTLHDKKSSLTKGSIITFDVKFTSAMEIDLILDSLRNGINMISIWQI